MLQAVLVVLGTVVVAAVFLDAFTTTVSVSAKAGRLTRLVSGSLWRVLRRLETSSGPSPLSSAGVLTLVATLLTWVLLLWAGFTLIFAAGEPAVVQSSTGDPAGGVSLVYFVGFTIFTLGIGDFVPADGVWQIVTAVASFSGLLLVTLAITYLLSVVSAVVSRRSLAVHVHSLGSTPAEIVVGGWTGSSFSSAFVQHLVSLASELATLSEQHLAYPVLHYFHPRDPATAGSVAIADLSEAMLLMETAVAQEARAPQSATGPVQYTVRRHLNSSEFAGSVNTPVAVPPLPDLSALRAAGLPLAPHEDYEAAAALQAERRRALHQLLLSEGWRWTDT